MKLASVFIFAVSLLAHAAQPNAQESPTNPYQLIVEHNVLRVKPSPATDNQPPRTPPPQIILNGITTILGDRRALFKTLAIGEDKERSYMLAEGQRDGEIELLSVDMREGKIKVNNHGIIQIVCLSQLLP